MDALGRDQIREESMRSSSEPSEFSARARLGYQFFFIRRYIENPATDVKAKEGPKAPELE